ncbi:GNAT family N-acetyltransferase [Pseudomonas sp. UBA2684]|uniref:GNAT family N-acetyltransferase n=1 Tax=Pseudomonas sp. UBA2684 TaxID=1947311 RepID=UPI000E867A57|nr:N-acetyltransferase [Pseudomonas sp. UBA2684]HBX55077.1 N-acetyltransferase [Pseudomonas sp.]|tara:strand:+ start:17078 stop:17584 length:507 start_codon:yes stop_codon:yes gene_type:complete
MTLDIRPETTADSAVINAVTTAAFLHAAHSSHTEQYIVSALRRAGQLTVSRVAELDGEVIGHVAISPVDLSDGTPDWYGLGPISVLPAYQGQGIGTQLMHASLHALRMHGAAGCVVLGDPAYYKRFGFKAEPALVLADVPPEYFMALAFDAALPQAVVNYHPAFAAQS